MSIYNFDEVIDRMNSNSSKWDGFEEKFPGLDAKGALPMWVADMDFKAPIEVVNAITKIASFGIYGYPRQKGAEFDAAVSGWLEKRHGWEIDNSWIIATSGVVPAITYAVQAFTKEGDGVIIQPPVYYPFKQRCIYYNNRKAVENSLRFNGKNYEIDFEDLEKKASDKSNKLLILSNPHNPVGRVWRQEELEQLVDICIRNQVIIFSDEIHSDLILNTFKHIPTGKISEKALDYLIAAYAPSKTFNLAGLRASAIVIPNKELRNTYKNQMHKDEAGGLNIFAEAGLIAAYQYGEDYLEELLHYLNETISYVTEFVQDKLTGVRLIQPEGTYLLWLDFRGAGLSPEEINKAVIEEAKVAGDLGEWFGEEGRGFIRLNIACPRVIVEEAMRRLERVFG